MSTRTQILEACVPSRLLYSVQAWELSAKELKKIEQYGMVFLEKLSQMISSARMFHLHI